MGLWLRNGGLGALGGFAKDFAATKWGHGLRNGTRVPKGCFATVKIFVGSDYGAAKWFRREGPISQQTLDFTASPFWLQKCLKELITSYKITLFE